MDHCPVEVGYLFVTIMLQCVTILGRQQSRACAIFSVPCYLNWCISTACVKGHSFIPAEKGESDLCHKSKKTKFCCWRRNEGVRPAGADLPAFVAIAQQIETPQHFAIRHHEQCGGGDRAAGPVPVSRRHAKISFAFQAKIFFPPAARAPPPPPPPPRHSCGVV